jgi:hypothetical protein
LTFWLERTSRKRSKNWGNAGTDDSMRKGTTSRVMADDRPYGEFYDFYSGRPKYFGCTLLLPLIWWSIYILSVIYI